MTTIFFLLGMAALFLGGELLVRGATDVARHYRLSPMIIGLTIVGFGTSSPELLVSVQAALAGQPDIALGSALGSNVSNILLILGVSALIAPLIIPFRQMKGDLAFMLGASLLIWWMLRDGQVSRLDGLILLIGLAAFLILAFRAGDDSAAAPERPRHSALIGWGMTGAGLLALVFGAQLLVSSATDIARAFGVSEAVIGLTIVAVGTSLPELATSLIAALRKQTEIAVGNIVGSNIFNILGILGLTAVITPIPAAPRFASVDMFWVTGSALGLVILAATLGGLPRKAGAALLAAYALFVWLML